MRYSLALMAVLAFAYCAQPEKTPAGPDAQEAPATETAGLASVEAIDAWFKGIQAGMGDLASAQSEITRGDAPPSKVTVFSNSNNAPIVVKAEHNGGPRPIIEEYYLDDGQVVLLRELIMGKTNTENRFYFDNNKLLAGMSRQVKGRMAWDAVPFGDYESPYGELDFRLKFDEVQQSVDNYIKGK